MAAKSVIDIACAHIDAQIADLNRAKDIIRATASAAPAAEPTERKTRKPRKPRGLPVQEQGL